MIADALSPQARTLIRTHRDVRRPTPADRERVTAALRAQLGTTVLPLDAPTGIRLMGNGAQRRLATACGVCVVGAGLFLARRPESARQSTAPAPNESAQVVPVAAATPAPVETPAPLAAPVAAQLEIAPVASQHARSKVTRAAPAQDTLAQELTLLTSAASGLNSGRAANALLTIEEHERRFSHGVLSDERNLAKARALCMLHRFDEGRAVLAAMESGTPASARVHEECALALARANSAGE